ncbi:type II secretion system F family protein [Vibrio vulnificus]|nr:type II secretion system F family protein [Vibrio vulnificus]
MDKVTTMLQLNRAKQKLAQQIMPLIEIWDRNKRRFISMLISRQTVMEYMREITEQSAIEQNFEDATKTLQQVSNKHFGNDFLKKPRCWFYSDIRKAYNKQPDLAKALTPYVSSADKLILNSGMKDIEAIKMVLDSNKNANAIQAILIKASLAPLGYFIAILGLINAFDGGIVATMIQLIGSQGKIPEGELALLLGIHDFVINGQTMLIPFVIAIIALYSWAVPCLKGKPRAVIESIPIVRIPFTVYRLIMASLVLKTLATLFQAGMPAQRAFKKIIEGSDPFIKQKVEEMFSVFKITGRTSDAFNNDLFGKEVRYTLDIYMSARNPDKHMNTIATKIEDSVLRKMTTVARGVNVSGLTLIATYIAIFVLANMSLSSYLQP